MSDALEASHNAFRENTEATVLSVINQVLEFYSDSYYKTKTEKVIPTQSRWQGVSCCSVPFVSVDRKKSWRTRKHLILKSKEIFKKGSDVKWEKKWN